MPRRTRLLLTLLVLVALFAVGTRLDWSYPWRMYTGYQQFSNSLPDRATVERLNLRLKAEFGGDVEADYRISVNDEGKVTRVIGLNWVCRTGVEGQAFIKATMRQLDHPSFEWPDEIHMQFKCALAKREVWRG
ncbi:hypothetical protein NRB16_19795 [Pseudomonas sp. LJDD11]|uniref:hypothetical protein n=1 Tax=Pseudomonas sp. LJDD11 TaxID=2931984 RepID=UPI00211B934D|nr:hypothetical protein [Pseudomonas sp. LJDD11]MCQ9425760.1 hypothetical protein [Pseudomonas sp. LJDD11]